MVNDTILCVCACTQEAAWKQRGAGSCIWHKVCGLNMAGAIDRAEHRHTKQDLLVEVSVL